MTTSHRMLSLSALFPVPIWRAATQVLAEASLAVDCCSGTRWFIKKAWTITRSPSHQNCAHTFATTVVICGGTKGIITNYPSQPFFSLQYMDFANVLVPLSFGWSFVELSAFKKRAKIILPSYPARPHPSMSFTRQRRELDYCMRVLQTFWQNYLLPPTSLLYPCNWLWLHIPSSPLVYGTLSLYSVL